MNSLFFNSAKPYQNMRCGLNVNIQSPNWYHDFEKTLKSIKGIKYIIDAEKGTAIVSGRVNPYSILKKLKKLNENAILAWIEIGNHQKGSFSGYETHQYHHQYPRHRHDSYWPPGGSLYDPYYGSSNSYGSVAVAPNYEPYSYWPSTYGWIY